MIEIWKDIKDFEGLYQVSNLGRVKSLKLNRELIMKPTKEVNGYLTINLTNNDGKHKKFLIHRLVVEAFIPNPDNKPQVDHINTDTTDNRVENLRWVTPMENTNNPLTLKHIGEFNKINRYWTGKYSKEHPQSKPILQYDLDGNFIREWNCTMDAHRELHIGFTSISNCLKNRSKMAGGFVWKYIEPEEPDEE